MVDATDSKSVFRKRVRVRVPSPADDGTRGSLEWRARVFLYRNFDFSACSGNTDLRRDRSVYFLEKNVGGGGIHGTG